MPDPVPTLIYYSAHPCSDLGDCKLEETSILRKVRRDKGPLYQQLLLELYQDGCPIAARHFECFVKEEKKLIAREYERFYVYQKPEFLLKIIDHVKAAEQIYRLDKKHGVYMSRKILNQLMGLVEEESIEWLTQRLYEVVCDYMLRPAKKDSLSREQAARFIFRYSRYLMQHGGFESHHKASNIIPIAMEIACSENWKPDTSPEDVKFPTLHAALCSSLTEIYLLKAKQPGITRKRAIKRVQKGLMAIAQVGPMKDKALTFKALLVKIDILIDASRYDWALRELRLLEKSLMNMQDPAYVPYQLDFLLKLGISMYSQDDPESAIRVFGEALNFGIAHNNINAEGDILLHIGQAQKLFTHGKMKARLAFQLAKTHFHLHGDNEKEQKIKYMIASLKAELITSNLYQLIKSTDYCDFYKLRQWKNLCEPFWEDDKKYGHLTRATVNGISLFPIHNVYKLYSLVLSTPGTYNGEEEGEEDKEAHTSSIWNVFWQVRMMTYILKLRRRTWKKSRISKGYLRIAMLKRQHLRLLKGENQASFGHL